MFLKSVGVIFFYFAYGSYYVLLKPRFIDLNATYFQILLIDSLPALVALTSVLWGRLADVLSRRTFLIFSSIGGAVIVLFSYVNTIRLLLFLLGILSIFSSMAIPIINALFSFDKEVEKSFSHYLLAQAVGWSLSGIFMGFFSSTLTFMRIGYWVGGISWILGIFLLSFTYKEEKGKVSGELVGLRYRPSLTFILLMGGLLFFEFGVVTSYGILSVKLYETLDKSKFLYGIFWATLPALASVAVSRLYGELVKKITPWNSLILISLMYCVNIAILSLSKGYLMALFWTLPLWNFVYIALYSAVSMLTPERFRASGFGITNSVLNLSMVLSALSGHFADKYGKSLGILIGIIAVLLSIVVFILVRGSVQKAETGKKN